ncbi:Uncharacterised protein [Amycolatopsis camponoti]|uniref:Uncharacterized protein n=1 Tax=Amycolatopsis camponoti TaxID=2606593 RepID=A0A6I8LLD0_9PSEU|nr:DUF2550 family protein [Amycolatopsis camponoti]VVJ15979.1 Uncharacterised protein [Amycolatopsis camponoti]
MLDAVIEGLLGLLDGAISDRRTRRRAEKRRAGFADGADVKMRCSLRRPADSGTWTHGTLRPAADGVVWRARLNRDEPIALSPRTVSWAGSRPAGREDRLAIPTAMEVVTLDDGGSRLELAVLTSDLTALREILGTRRK